MASDPNKYTKALRDDCVTVDRAEYEALKALSVVVDELRADLAAAHAKAGNRIHDLAVTCEAQARRLTELTLIVTNHERVRGLQQIFIDLLREDRPGTMSFSALSEFWRRWCVSSGAQPRDEAAKFEPGLFKAWRDFVAGVGKWSVAGTRAEVEARASEATASSTAQAREAEYAAQLRSLSDYASKLEAELEAYKKGR